MNTEEIRAMIGAAKFEETVKKFKARGVTANMANSGAAMEQEPDNRGLNIKEAREALERASNREFPLPDVDTLVTE